MPHPLQTLLTSTLKGRRTGIYSVCSAHPWALRAAAEQARDDQSLLLIEATSNQVNQFGGYTSMQPVDFRNLVEKIVDEAALDRTQVILGGDHLGPNPWRHLDAETAMRNAIEMVIGYASAGFSKIHLDASMPCLGEPSVLSEQVVAERAARLCAAAEAAAAAAGVEAPVYVIGTEVPTPGGATHEILDLLVTMPSAAERTLQVHQQAFAAASLQTVWQRVLALVVQPGVEFDHDSVIDYQPAKAQSLARWLQQQSGSFVFEAHSTDYQKSAAYSDLVQDGFAILKVGPALTFAMREALFALAELEHNLVPAHIASHLRHVVEQGMLAEPDAWKPYYSGDEEHQRLLRVYSYSDRMRYYWNHPSVAAAVAQLIRNLSEKALPETMLSAYLPKQYEHVRNGSCPNEPAALIVDKVRDVLRVYAAAC